MERCLLGIQAAEKTDRRKNPKWHYRRLLPEKWNRQFMWFTNNIEPFISNHQLGWGNINTGNREDHQCKESHLAASGEPWCDPTTDTLVRWAVKGWEPELNWQHGVYPKLLTARPHWESHTGTSGRFFSYHDITHALDTRKVVASNVSRYTSLTLGYTVYLWLWYWTNDNKPEQEPDLTVQQTWAKTDITWKNKANSLSHRDNVQSAHRRRAKVVMNYQHESFGISQFDTDSRGRFQFGKKWWT